MNTSWTRLRGWLVFLLVLAVVAGIVTFQWRRPHSSPEPLVVASATPTVVDVSTPPPLRVYVSGAVLRPDVYDLPPGSIVKDALLAAGGATEDADLDCINLALPLSDALHVYVPRVGEASPPAPNLRSSASGGGTVNLNTATAAELETLPGIGPTLAQRIVEYRQTHGPFQAIEDVMDVSGIGSATFEKIQDLISTN